MEKVIVIGCGVPGYAVIRALANKGIDIVAMTYSSSDFAQHSRHVSEIVTISRPEENDGATLIELLIANAPRWGGALILETSDNAARVLAKHKRVLSEHYKVATPDWEVANVFLEKDKTYALAKECDVPFPKGVTLSTLDDLKGAAGLRFPAILKPVNSLEFQNWFHKKNMVVNNDAELQKEFALCVKAVQSMVLQEIIPGPDANLFKLQGYINSKGTMVGKFFHRKLRQHPPRFGVMRVGVSTEPYPEVALYSEKLFQRSNYRGYFSIEFKKDPRTGLLNLMENNCRMPRSGLLSIASGVNYPWIIYQDLVQNIQVDVVDYKMESYWIELYADLADILHRRDNKEITFAEYVRPYLAKHKVFSDLDFRDLKPFLKLTGAKFGKAFRRRVRPVRKVVARPQS